jgi:Zn finger protein HypA/HybF involved in hydrogenase expression
MQLEVLRSRYECAQQERSKAYEQWQSWCKKCGEIFEQIRREEVRAELLKEQEQPAKEGAS